MYECTSDPNAVTVNGISSSSSGKVFQVFDLNALLVRGSEFILSRAVKEGVLIKPGMTKKRVK